MSISYRTLDEQRAEFASNRFLAMPIAGAIAWSAIGIAGTFLSVAWAAWALFIGTGMTFYLGLLVARLLTRQQAKAARLPGSQQGRS